MDARGGDNRVFFGDATLPNPQAVIGEVLVPNGMWLLHAEPKDGWSHEAPYAPVLRLAFLLLGATLIFPILVGGQMGEERKRHMRAVAVRETELRRLSRRLGMALQASHIGVWENDINTGTLNWDDRINAMYGLPQDGGGRTYTDWRNAVHPEDRERAEAEFREAVQETGQYASEFRIIRQTDGAVRHIRAIGAVYDDLGATPKIAGVNLDVTEDHRRHQPPELRPGALPDRNRIARNKGRPTLDEAHRAGKHHLAAVAGAERCLALRLVLPVVEAECPDVLFERIEQVHHQIPGPGDAAQFVVRLEQFPAERSKAHLVHLRLGGDHRHKPLHQPGIGTDQPLEPGPDHPELVLHLAAGPLLVELVVLVFAIIGQRAHDQRRAQRRQARWTAQKPPG